jgi:DNA-binding NarL/FixJ family response regulator
VHDPLRILLADDNPAILDMLQRMLQKDFAIAGAVNNATSVLREAPELKPDVIILDVSMGDLNGFDVTRQLRASQCTAKIIFLTVHEDFEFIRAAFDAGASGYVFKSRMNTDLRAALEAIKNGKVFIPDASMSQ